MDRFLQKIGNYFPKKVAEEQLIIDNPEEILNDFHDYYCRDAQEVQMLKNGDNFYYWFSYTQRVYAVTTDAIQCIAVEHYRCGVMTTCSRPEYIAVMSDSWGHSDEPVREIASPEFSQNFRVYAKDQKTAEDFLNPVATRALLEAKRYFHGLNVEMKNKKINASFACGKLESWDDFIFFRCGNAKRRFTDFLAKLR